MIYIPLRIKGITVKGNSNVSVPFQFKEHLKYFIKLHAWSKKNVKYRQIEVILKIKEITINGNEIESRNEKFYNKKLIEWMPSSSYPSQEFAGEGYLSLEFPNSQDDMLGIDIEVIQYNTSVVNNLKIKNDKRIQILRAVEDYANDKYREAISKIGIVSEHIAKKLASKTGKKFNKFRGAVNFLSNLPMSDKKKINYNFLGALLFPIYYVRNQQAHPDPKIAFDKSLTEMLFENLKQIIGYIANKKIIISS